MRFHSIFSVLAVFGLVACKDSTAPNPAESIRLSPFEQSAMTVPIGFYFGNRMKIFVPAGIDPIFDLTVQIISDKDPNLDVRSSRHLDTSSDCDAGCTRTVWDILVAVMARSPGEALISVCLRANPSECSSFKFVAIVEEKG